jgi:thiosulfate dehydrogenase
MESNNLERLIKTVSRLLWSISLLVVIIIGFIFYLSQRSTVTDTKEMVQSENSSKKKSDFWEPVSLEAITDTTQKNLAEYGKKLIAETAVYIGPQGPVAHTANGMNCQNCHLQAGTAVFGNNYGSVASLYPKFRARSGSVENIYKRVNDCFERSLNGKALDTNSREMQAIVTYINHIGSNIKKGEKAKGSGLKELAYIDRAADAPLGKKVYVSKCLSCHGAEGQGQKIAGQPTYSYPPLWGENSFNDGAGLYRISNFARYAKYNMPQGVTHETTQLSDEEAWDVAAFVLTQPRPHIAVPKDWPDISKKPIDHPFGPYADGFSEKQHKLGPFKPIAALQKNK